MVREIGLIALIIGAWLGWRWLVKQPKQTQWQWIAIIATVVLLGLALNRKITLAVCTTCRNHSVHPTDSRST